MIYKISQKVFTAIRNKMVYASRNTIKDSNFYVTCRGMEKQTIDNILDCWRSLNQRSVRPGKSVERTGQDTPAIYTLKQISPYQFVNYLRLVRFNIDLEIVQFYRKLTDDEITAMKFLALLLQDVCETIVTNTAEYQACDWFATDELLDKDNQPTTYVKSILVTSTVILQTKLLDSAHTAQHFLAYCTPGFASTTEILVLQNKIHAIGID